ncbi:FAD-dependent monooxygenase [Phaeacidiphilus oryzae]|uniref:FAD-dependent monooxygenase n=1 Tax=Phaeacidiphilus oryzae TaxID=348818 RepID=UPI00055A783D|nr:FAD-dependent monooxygenase [Phaeacidiphilus oryzae]
MTSQQRSARVLVAGGGPVGMLAAAELGRYGVDTLVLESNPRTVDQPKAGTLHARSVQSLARRGYLRTRQARPDDLRERRTEAFHFAGVPGLAITAPGTEPPPILGRAQADLERDFEARARERGVRVLRGHRVTGLRQDPDGVAVTAEGPAGPEVFTAEYLIGADGARSTVREAAGIGSRTHPATVAALLGLVRLVEPGLVPPGWHRTPNGWIISGINPFGHSRVITIDFSGPHPDRRAEPTLEELRAEAARVLGRPVPMDDAVFLSRFSDFARVVRRYREGRVLLAGDAAHVHFPVGGQGLNLGLQDAVDLSWKLAFTLTGRAGKGLLDSYDEDRRPAAERVVENTRAQLALMRPDPALDPLRGLMAELLTLGQVNDHLGDMISAQEDHNGRFLPNLPLEVDGSPTDLIRLLDHPRALLLVLSPEPRLDVELVADPDGYAPEGWVRSVRAVRAKPPAGVRLPWDALLLRPDGYLAWAPGDRAGARAALRHWFGEPEPS